MLSFIGESSSDTEPVQSHLVSCWYLPAVCLCSLPGDKKNSPSVATTAKNHLNLRRKQALRGKNSPVLKKTPNKGLIQVTRHRLCRLLPSRAHFTTKEGMPERRHWQWAELNYELCLSWTMRCPTCHRPAHTVRGPKPLRDLCLMGCEQPD